MNPCNDLTGALRALYVEDHPETLEELKRFLKRRVCRLAVADSGEAALALLEQERFDVVITDLKLPGMDGLELIRALRRSGSQIPVVITSAFSDSDTILQAVDLGIVKYCVKPVRTEELTAILDRIAAEKLGAGGADPALTGRLLDRENRMELEKQLRAELARLLKQLTGKGPKDVTVSLSPDTLEVKAQEVLTPLEAHLSGDRTHHAMLAYLRQAFYKECAGHFERALEELLDARVSLQGVQSDTERNQDRIVFRILPR